MTPRYEELPSGKKIIRQFDAGGQVTSEMHAYGAVHIALKMDITGGAKTAETFIVKNRLVSRASYERARQKFLDMPLPDMSLEDVSGELVRAAGRERRQRRQAAAAHKPDREGARQIDAFCRAMMERGPHVDAVSWIESSLNTLGERSHAASRQLVAKLLRLGCVRIHACASDSYDEGRANSGHLVVELPVNVDQRKAVLRQMDRFAKTQGHSGDFDDGQQYAYLKLD